MIKVERSQPAPASLAEEAKKKNGEYNKPDVTEWLKRDFHNKCYICGMDRLQDAVVEHRLLHKNGTYPERKFDWNNLFWSCMHCNSVKNRDMYDVGIILSKRMFKAGQRIVASCICVCDCTYCENPYFCSALALHKVALLMPVIATTCL